MSRRQPKLTAYHPDGSECPTTGPDRHRLSPRGYPRTDGCTGRATWIAVCQCGWRNQADLKVVPDDNRRRHTCP
ncbi:hypothetical protein K7B10_07645 [Streptomyces flavotricini]|uniref:Uncharacterized protein n=1 Tax=Streptomyces flavotricini TaxID=66888 RepID=A0ABS8E238_9ACTN|nr:hypothetical protein [Streptomyces flavotricini]MCC0094657.1 hypothetical protein [Streptomyces flavotricini]